MRALVSHIVAEERPISVDAWVTDARAGILAQPSEAEGLGDGNYRVGARGRSSAARIEKAVGL
jgi:hypothetical protein